MEITVYEDRSFTFVTMAYYAATKSQRGMVALPRAAGSSRTPPAGR
ncbi:hypothetical protein ABZ557_26570 [Streptomyces sp. NPDC019645]